MAQHDHETVADTAVDDLAELIMRALNAAHSAGYESARRIHSQAVDLQAEQEHADRAREASTAAQVEAVQMWSAFYRTLGQ